MTIEMDDQNGDHQDPKEWARLSAEILLQDAHEAIESQDLEGALELLRAAAVQDPDRIELEGFVDGVRSQLLKQYRDRVGDEQGIPKLIADTAAIMRFNLPADAGFLLSLVDGKTTIREIVSISGMDAFDAFRILNGLFDAKIAAVDT